MKRMKQLAGTTITMAVLLAAAPFTAAAAESKTIQEDMVTLEFNGYVGSEGAKTYKVAAAPKGISLDAYNLDEYTLEWLNDTGRSGYGGPDFSLALDALYIVGENSVANIAKAPAYQDKRITIYPSCYWLDSDGNIAYIVDYAGMFTEIKTEPSRFFSFDNINPTEAVRGNHFFEGSSYSGKIPTENLLYVLEISENESSEALAAYGFRIGEEEPSSGYDETNFTFAQGNVLEVPVNGKDVAFEAYVIGNNNYVKLRDVAKALDGTASRFNVSWDSGKKAISLIPGTAYQAAGTELPIQKMLDEQKAQEEAAEKNGGSYFSMGVSIQSYAPQSRNAAPNTAKIYLDGASLSIAAYQIDGNTYFKLRDLGEALNFAVDWDAVRKTAVITTK